MDFIRRQVEDGYIVIHHVVGDRVGIEWLRQTSRVFLERLIYLAKRDGQTSFVTNDITYSMGKNRDGSFSISIYPDQSDQTPVI